MVATPNGLIGSCSGGTITAASGTGAVSLSGAALAASGWCSFTINVTGTSPGLKTNTVTVSSTETGTGNTSSANLQVIAPATIAKAFGTGSLQLNGSTTLTFNLSNPNTATTLTGVGFTDVLPAGLVVSTPNGLTGSCGGGAIGAVAGSNSVSLSGANVAANTACSFTVNVTATGTGTKNNTTGAVTSTEGGTGGTASASLVVGAVATATVIPTLQDWALVLLGLLLSITALRFGGGRAKSRVR